LELPKLFKESTKEWNQCLLLQAPAAILHQVFHLCPTELLI
jgi:hypothetical protein